VEVWHPSRLAREYEETAPIVRYISDQILGRLIRMNRFIAQLGTKGFKKQVQPETMASQRSYYRKDLNRSCEYRPLDIRKAAWLKGTIRNISLSGLGLDVSTRNSVNFSHELGKVFRVRTTLPNGKELEVDARIVTARKAGIPGRLDIGLAIVNITEEARKTLGFFLMP
jgi:c-di-GMP-binding flagellar brake protein YcgR